MRESDQASVIYGSLQLAQDGDLVDRDFYNYDRTYISYWILAGIYSSSGIDISDSVKVVALGNTVACVVFLLGLVIVFITYGPTNRAEWIIACSCLFSPVILFSAPLLSSNVISAGWLFFLVLFLRKEECLSNCLICGLFGFLAVGARADALLVMPLLACLSSKEASFMSMVKSRRLWILAVSSVLALILGTWLSSSAAYNPSKFFNSKLFLSYLVFSMNGSLVVLIVICLFLVRTSVNSRNCFPILVLLSIIMPLMFYGNLLYSPRHLMTTVLLILFIVLFPRGSEYLRNLRSSRYGKLSLMSVAVATLFSSLVGIRMSSMKSGKFVLSEPTLYPTADGLWPMGGNFRFLSRLKKASTTPIDHNQRVWQGWLSINAEDLPTENINIRSNGLSTYGELRIKMLGRNPQKLWSPHSVIMLDGRSILRGVATGEELYKSEIISNRKDFSFSSGTNLSKVCGAEIFLIDGRGKEIDSNWVVLQCLKEIVIGDEYIIRKGNNSSEYFSEKGPYTWFIVVSENQKEAVSRWEKANSSIKIKNVINIHGKSLYRFEYNEESGKLDFSILPEDVWIAKSAMATFMKRKLIDME